MKGARVDCRRVLGDAEFAVDIYAEPPGRRDQQRALAEGIVAAEEEVAREMGAHYPAMARVFVAALPATRYVFVAAHRPASG